MRFLHDDEDLDDLEDDDEIGLPSDLDDDEDFEIPPDVADPLED